MWLTWSLSRGDAQSLGFSVIPSLGDVDREKEKKNARYKKGTNLRKREPAFGVCCI